MKDRVINRNEIHLAAKWSTTFHIPHCLGYISSSSGHAWTRLLDINSSKWIWLSPEKTNRLSTSPSSLNGILRCSNREEHVFQFQFRITLFPLYRQVITLNKEPICELWENLFLFKMTIMSCCGFSGSSWFRVSVSLFSVSTQWQPNSSTQGCQTHSTPESQPVCWPHFRCHRLAWEQLQYWEVKLCLN